MIETTSLELSKKLEGILDNEHKSLMTWSIPMAPLMNKSADHRNLRFRGHKSKDMAAYTAGELMKVLPKKIKYKDRMYTPRLYPDGDSGDWYVDYIMVGDSYIASFKIAPLQEALGEMVVWLHGEGLLAWH